MNKVILHTEASLGWGGQEIRIVRESCGMREQGYEIILAAPPTSKIFARMRELGFQVYPVYFEKKYFLGCLARLFYIFSKHKVDSVNTHSSNDAWIAGIAARLAGKFIVRTRHLSSFIRPGFNSRILYNKLADQVVTTCEEIAVLIKKQAHLDDSRCRCIATGLDPSVVVGDRETFREKYGIRPEDRVVGTLCILRSWKGIADLLQAAKLLNEPNLKWLIVGSGGGEKVFRKMSADLGIEDRVIFTGHIEPPYSALLAMDIFMLLSTASEGISQSSLQAAFLEKPLITTPTGGLKEVCLDGKTGFLVPVKCPAEVAKAVKRLLDNPVMCQQMGAAGKALVLEKYTFQQTINSMICVYTTGVAIQL